jgi:hypothetical protein
MKCPTCNRVFPFARQPARALPESDEWITLIITCPHCGQHFTDAICPFTVRPAFPEEVATIDARLAALEEATPK